MTFRDILEKTAAQIKKDFLEIPFDCELTDQSELKDVAFQVKSLLEPIYTNDHQKFMRVINRVDLSEKQYHNLKTIEGEFMLNVAKAVVLRELQKVLIKFTYAGEAIPAELPENWDKLWDK